MNISSVNSCTAPMRKVLLIPFFRQESVAQNIALDHRVSCGWPSGRREPTSCGSSRRENIEASRKPAGAGELLRARPSPELTASTILPQWNQTGFEEAQRSGASPRMKARCTHQLRKGMDYQDPGPLVSRS